MTSEQFKQLLVPLSLPWVEAAARMDETAQGVLLVIDLSGRLARTVTDGDLRRAMLQQTPGGCTLGELPGQPPLVVRESATTAEIQQLLSQHGIAHVPVVNDQGLPVDLVTSRELSQRIWLSSPHLGDEETAFVEDAFKHQLDRAAGPARRRRSSANSRPMSASATPRP